MPEKSNEISIKVRVDSDVEEKLKKISQSSVGLFEGMSRKILSAQRDQKGGTELVEMERASRQQFLEGVEQELKEIEKRRATRLEVLEPFRGKEVGPALKRQLDFFDKLQFDEFKQQFDIAESILPISNFAFDEEKLLKQIRERFQGVSSANKAAVLSIQDLIDAEDDLDFVLEDVSEETEHLGAQSSSLIDVMSGLIDTTDRIGPTAQNTFGMFGNALMQSTQTGERGMNDLLATSQNMFRALLTDTQTTTRSATGAFQDFTQSSEKLISDFTQSSERLISDVLFSGLKGDIDSAEQAFKAFGNSILRTLTDTIAEVAAAKVSEKLVEPAISLGIELLSSAVGLAEGGIVKKPTLALVGEAGPEAVIPLGGITGRVANELLAEGLERLSTEIGRAVGREILKQQGVNVGGELARTPIGIAAADAAGGSIVAGGITGAAVGALTHEKPAAGAFKGLVTGTMTAALTAALGPIGFILGIVLSILESKAMRRAVSGFFGDRFKGLLGKKRGRTPTEAGLGNFFEAAKILGGFDLATSIGANNFDQMTNGIAARFDSLAKGAGDAFRRLSSLIGDPRSAVRITADQFRIVTAEQREAREAFLDSGDAAGRFVTRPSLRLIGEGGPEHVFNVNSPQSVDFFRQGVRPIIREIFEEERGAMGGGSVRVDLRGAFFPDSRSVEKLFRLLEDFRRGRRLSGRGIA